MAGDLPTWVQWGGSILQPLTGAARRVDRDRRWLCGMGVQVRRGALRVGRNKSVCPDGPRTDAAPRRRCGVQPGAAKRQGSEPGQVF